MMEFRHSLTSIASFILWMLSEIPTRPHIHTDLLHSLDFLALSSQSGIWILAGVQSETSLYQRSTQEGIHQLVSLANGWLCAYCHLFKNEWWCSWCHPHLLPDRHKISIESEYQFSWRLQRKERQIKMMEAFCHRLRLSSAIKAILVI